MQVHKHNIVNPIKKCLNMLIPHFISKAFISCSVYIQDAQGLKQHGSTYFVLSVSSCSSVNILLVHLKKALRLLNSVK